MFGSFSSLTPASGSVSPSAVTFSCFSTSLKSPWLSTTEALLFSECPNSFFSTSDILLVLMITIQNDNEQETIDMDNGAILVGEEHKPTGGIAKGNKACQSTNGPVEGMFGIDQIKSRGQAIYLDTYNVAKAGWQPGRRTLEASAFR